MSKEIKDLNDKEFAQLASDTLEHDLQGIDAASLSKLRQAREKALQAARGKKVWLNQWLNYAFPTAAAALFALVIMLKPYMESDSTDLHNAPIELADNFEFIVDIEDIEFYEEMEFYEWLELEYDAT